MFNDKLYNSQKRKRPDEGGFSDKESVRALEEEEKDENEFYEYFTQ